VKHANTKLATTIVLFSLLVSTNAQCANPLGLYVGAGGGRADLRVDPVTCDAVNCSDATVGGWTTFAGLQPLPFLGAELQYLDFGHTTLAGDHPYYQRARALAVFATGDVPLRFVDLYAKVGAGLVYTRATALVVDGIECILHLCEDVEDKDATRFGWGLGARFKLPKLSSLALQAEYVRFSVPNGDPDLLSVALLWKF
jgi:Outer membrane protein beta-barrel domain